MQIPQALTVDPQPAPLKPTMRVMEEILQILILELSVLLVHLLIHQNPLVNLFEGMASGILLKNEMMGTPSAVMDALHSVR